MSLHVQVCVVGNAVYRVRSQWADVCQTCTCSWPTGLRTSLRAVPSAQCSPRVCDRSCPSVRNTHTHAHARTHTHAHAHAHTLYIICSKTQQGSKRCVSAGPDLQATGGWAVLWVVQEDQLRGVGGQQARRRPGGEASPTGTEAAHGG